MLQERGICVMNRTKVSADASREPALHTERQPLGTTTDVAEYLQVPDKTLIQWRWLGTGPKFHRVGRHVRYRWEDVVSWLESQASGDDAR